MESSSRRSKRLGAGSKPRPSYVERTSSSSEERSSEDEVNNGAAGGDAAVGDAAMGDVTRSAPGAAVISPAAAATSSPVPGTVSECFDTPRRKLPSVPPTPICRNCPTPRQTLTLHNEITALKLSICELQAQVAANASAIGALPATHATPV